jgi:hypothetical protein
MSISESVEQARAAYQRTVHRHRENALDKIRVLTRVPYQEQIDTAKIAVILLDMDQRIEGARKLYLDQLDGFK